MNRLGTEGSRVTRRDILTGGAAVGVGLVLAGRFAIPIAQGQETVWLHVRVDRRMDDQQQISTAQAWTTSDKDGKNRITVGTLHLVLDGFRHQADQCTRCDYMRLEEVHLGSDAAKATATAWCEDPAVGPVTKSVE